MFKETVNILKSVSARFMAAAALCLAAVLLAASAVSVASAAPNGSISLACSYTRSGSTVYLGGDRYALTKVADLAISPTGACEYRTLPDFSAFDADWTQLSASDRRRCAKAMDEYASANRRYDEYATSDPSGNLSFDRLDLGLYLVSRVAVDEANAEYVLNAFLVSIPYTVGGEAVYQVEVKPKFAQEHRTAPSPDDPGSPDTLRDPGASDEPGAPQTDPAPVLDTGNAAAGAAGSPQSRSTSAPLTGEGPLAGIAVAAVAVSSVIALQALKKARSKDR